MIIIDGNNWHEVERPGYFGRHRDDKYREYDQRFGPGRWQLAWHLSGAIYLELQEAVMLYEDAYWQFLASSRDVLDELQSACSNVYDDDVSNVSSGTDYSRQETGRTHLQDIAIRRCMLRLGLWFSGSGLLRIRDREGEHPLSLTLSPGRVPFHMPWLLLGPQTAGWWEPGSVESFWQTKKTLLARP